MKATLFTVKRNACCAFCWSPLHWSEAPNGGHWRLIVPDVEFVLREPGPRHPAGHRQEAGLGPAALQLGRAGGHGRRASQVGSCEKIVQKEQIFRFFFSQGRLCRKCLATTETPSTSDLYLIFLQAVRKWSSEVGRSSEIKFKFTGEHSPLQISPVLKRWLIVMSQRQVPSSLFIY